MSHKMDSSELKRAGIHAVLTDARGALSSAEAAKLGTEIPPGDWFVIGPREVELHPNLVDLLAHASHERPDVGIFYGDEVAVRESVESTDLFLKPDWDLTLLLSNDYIGLPLFVRPAAARQTGGIDSTKGTAASFDLLLRAHAMGVAIARIPKVLGKYHGQPLGADVEERAAAIRAWWPKTSRNAIEVTAGLVPGSLRVEKVLGDPPDVTLVVPTRQTVGDAAVDGAPFVVKFLDSLAGSTYPMEKLHVLLGDDVESDAVYAGRHWPFALQRVVTRRAPGESFNYAAKMNSLWRQAATEHVILMNDDITIRSADWIQALLAFSTQTDVGGAGARLLYPTQEIQHAGMPGGVYGLCTHAWIGEPASAPTYQDWAAVQREWSIVTGAVFATRKSLLHEVNGFDERFRLDFNDVDLCLKLKMLGYRIVYTPHAELVHHEKGSRGASTWPPSELALFLERWREFLDNDPAFHPGLSKNHHKIQPVRMYGEWWQQAGRSRS